MLKGRGKELDCLLRLLKHLVRDKVKNFLRLGRNVEAAELVSGRHRQCSTVELLRYCHQSLLLLVRDLLHFGLGKHSMNSFQDGG